MGTRCDISPADFRTRLIAFLLVLVVGVVSGWVNGRSGDTSDPTQAGIVAQSGSTEDERRAAPSADATDTADATENADEGAHDDAGEQAVPQAPESQGTDDSGVATVAPERGPTVTEDGQYTSKDEVALYLHTYGHLPSNFIGKTKARQRGWNASKGNLDEVLPGMSIGGSVFYNDEGKLPDRPGRRWTECDINYHGGYRGAERIVFSNDGLIYYTDDHYRTFERLY